MHVESILLSPNFRRHSQHNLSPARPGLAPRFCQIPVDPGPGHAYFFTIMEIRWKNYIESNPQVLKGKPCLRNTRIPVSLILGYLASGSSTEQIIAEFPDLEPIHITACLDYARELAESEVAG